MDIKYEDRNSNKENTSEALPDVEYREGDRSMDEEFEQIIADAVSIQNMSETKKRSSFYKYLKNVRNTNWEVPMAVSNPTGALIVCSKEASDRYVMCNLIHEVTFGLPVDDALQALIECGQRALKCSIVVPGRVREQHFRDPYNYVNMRFGFESVVIQHGSFVVIAPSIDDYHTVAHQMIMHDGEYKGMIVTTQIVNSEIQVNPVYQTFESIAYAIDQYSRLYINPENDPDIRDLILKSSDGELDSMDLEFLIAGLAYGSPYWDVVHDTDVLESMDDELCYLWQMQIEKILSCGNEKTPSV